MKFTCESCGAQYMISDEKVGPNGVKVRCKKCSNVIVVRRAAAVAAEAAAPAAAPVNGAASGGGGAPGAGLDLELGQAFDHAFGDPPPSTPAPAPGGGDQGDTQLMGAEDAAKVFSSSAEAAPASTEWYVAIGQAQVGPLPLPEVKRKWEAGDVGPDSLVWRPGMADWLPLSSVSDLAGYLAPVPRTSAPGARAAAPADPAASPEPQPAKPAGDVTWKPVGASALAALASEEIATRAAPEVRPAAARPAGVKSLVDALPDGGGVDPTGALPLSIKALETTGEKKLERRSSVARGAEQVRQRRSTARSVAIGVVLGVVIVGGAAVGGVVLYRKLVPAPAPAVAAAPAPAPVAPAAALPVPVAPPAPAPVEPAAATPAPAPAVATTPVAAGIAAATASPPPAAEPEKPAASAKAARASPPPRPEKATRQPTRHEPTKVAAAPAPAPAAPAPAKRKGDLLDFESNDDALNDALGSGAGKPGRSVYVPPARAGAGALPDKVSTGDINAAVAGRIDSLRRCVSEQKAREPDATGTLKMRWIIQGDGGVRDVKCLTSEYAQGAFAQCIAGVVKTIRFPRSSTAGQEVTFPFNF